MQALWPPQTHTASLHLTWQAAVNMLTILVVISMLTYFGVLPYVWAHDIFYTATTAFFYGIGCLLLSVYRPVWASRGLAICPAIGLLGTVIGLSYMLTAYSGQGDEGKLHLLQGMFTVMHTTGVGIAGYIACYFQREALRHG